MEEFISLKDIFSVIRKRIVLIISLGLIALIGTAIVSFFLLTPVYQASTQILVNQQQTDNQIQSTEIQTNLQLINTYNVIIKSPAILDKVSETLSLNLTADDLSNMITVSNADNSQVVNLQVQNTDYNLAVSIANTTAEVFQREIQDLMNVDNVNILSKAEELTNPSPVSPNNSLNMVIGLVLGLMLGIGLAFFMEYLDNTVKGEADIEEVLNLPVIGLVSTIQTKDLESLGGDIRKRRRGGRENV